MNKKGFTLIEILSVVVLLGAIALIAVPTIKNMINDSRQKLYDEQINMIEDGLKNWGSANVFLLPEDNNSVKLTLGQLKQAGFVETKITNPKSNKCFSDESTLSITNHNNSYIYKVENVIDVDCNSNEDTPTIKLNGDIIEYLYIGDTYVDNGVIAKDSNGNDITESVTTTITGSGTSIDTSQEGNYVVTYNVVDNGKSITTIKNILVTYKYKNGIMSSMDNCINTGTCPKGTEVKVAVNDQQSYKFYTIKDDGDNLTLIMGQSLGSGVAWINAEDYTIENNKDETPNTCSSTSCTDEGPITAINYLDELTDEKWNNIPKKDYTYSGLNSNGTRKYEDIIRNMRARIITYDETKELGCTTSAGSCPSYIYGGSQHWTLTPYDSNVVWYVFNDGSLHYTAAKNSYDIRPVIEISK